MYGMPIPRLPVMADVKGQQALSVTSKNQGGRDWDLLCIADPEHKPAGIQVTYAT
jgi:hypothetical protein